MPAYHQHVASSNDNSGSNSAAAAGTSASRCRCKAAASGRPSAISRCPASRQASYPARVWKNRRMTSRQLVGVLFRQGFVEQGAGLSAELQLVRLAALAAAGPRSVCRTLALQPLADKGRPAFVGAHQEIVLRLGVIQRLVHQQLAQTQRRVAVPPLFDRPSRHTSAGGERRSAQAETRSDSPFRRPMRLGPEPDCPPNPKTVRSRAPKHRNDPSSTRRCGGNRTRRPAVQPQSLAHSARLPGDSQPSWNPSIFSLGRATCRQPACMLGPETLN